MKAALPIFLARLGLCGLTIAQEVPATHEVGLALGGPHTTLRGFKARKIRSSPAADWL